MILTSMPMIENLIFGDKYYGWLRRLLEYVIINVQIVRACDYRHVDLCVDVVASQGSHSNNDLCMLGLSL